jgi:Holliday junction resolvase-like predicted endonuclease
MSLASLRTAVRRRLDESPGGDHGWWITTRVHLDAGWLQAFVTYLHDAGFEQPRRLSDADYFALGRLAGVRSDDPGVTLRRHQLLAMEKPLRLIARTDGRSWGRIHLTAEGLALATNQDTGSVLEDVLSAIRFCEEPWFTPQRAAEYSEFSIRPYRAALDVMAQVDGWIDRDEHDLFVSRLRSDAEVLPAVPAILDFRQLSPGERESLLEEVRRRIDGEKPYQNWRDMALHTFSLFSLGTSAVRLDRRLTLVSRSVESGGGSRRPAPGRRAPQPRRTQPLLDVPEAPPELAAPPVAPAANVGTDGELLVGKILEADGWSVVYYSNRRGFGFDIWAQRGQQAMLVEVKSSLQQASTVTMTRLEFEAAERYRANYVLAIAEHVASSAPTVHFIIDPATVLTVTEATAPEYRVGRASWHEHSVPALSGDTPIG